MKVIKRDGSIQEFNFNKIEHAVQKAFKSVKQDVPENFLEQLMSKFQKVINKQGEDGQVSIEEIQDQIRNFLIEKNKFDVVESFIIYRNERDLIRESKSKLTKEISSKLRATNVQNQNANVDEASFGGRQGEAARAVSKNYALNYCMSKMAKNNHLNNEIYIHDLDSYAVGCHNCLSIPFDDLLAKGFITRQTDVRPAMSINTAFQLLAVIFQLQSLQQFGGVSATHLDWTMVPYVKKSFFKHFVIEYIIDVMSEEETNNILAMSEEKFDEWLKSKQGEITESLGYTEDQILIDNKELKEKYHRYYKGALLRTRKELYQAVEGMFHNLNTLQSRSGNQLPFTSVNFGTCTSTEGRMVIKAMLESAIKGVGKYHKTPIFPCVIFQYWDKVNGKPGTPNYDMYRLALKSTSKRLYPNYANVGWSGNKGFDENDPRTYFSTMGCRTANGFDINGFGQLKDGRGNICPVTIIMPTLAMEVKTELSKSLDVSTGSDEFKKQLIEKFMELLDKKIGEAKDMLIERFEWIASQPSTSAKFMYENHTMAGYIPEEGIRSALKHGTLALGQLGLAETLQILIGDDQTSDEGMELAKRIEGLYKQRCAEYKEKYKLNFGVYFTPAENLCFTALKKFQDKYGIIPNVSDKKFFTNSIHIPVWKEIDPFEKIDYESQLTGYSSAGCITYVELPSTTQHNISALESIVNYAMEHDIPYFAVNIPVDSCDDCGYTDEIGETCPICGSSHITRLRRVTGYLSTSYLHFNLGKIDEVEHRVKHIKN